MSFKQMHQEFKVRERANAAATKACTRFGVFVFDPANRYRPENAVKLFKSEKLADKAVQKDWDAGHAKNHVVRTVNVCSVAEQNAIRDKKLGLGGALRGLGGGETNFVAAKAHADQLWSNVKAAGNALSSLTVKGKMGLPTDASRMNPARISAKRAYDAAFARLQNYNSYFTKQFARELAEERRQKRQGGILGAARDLRPLEPALIEVNADYLRTALDLRPLVTGKKANRILGYGGEWTGKVVGTDPETGAQVTVAWYEHPYETTPEAKRRASQLLRYVKAQR